MRHLVHALLWAHRHRAGELSVPELLPLLGCLRADDVFLDVGVHAGSWTVPASRMLTEGRVYAFEALPYYGRVLKTTLALLRRRNVEVVFGAVSDRAGEVDLLWKDAAGQRLTGMTHIKPWGEEGETVRVRTLTIDDFCDQHAVDRVRLVKCDVEGAELMVLRGAASTIDRFRPLVFCEVYDSYCARYGYSSRDVFAFFEPREYRPMQFVAGSFRPVSVQSYDGAGDVLFVPRETEVNGSCA